MEKNQMNNIAFISSIFNSEKLQENLEDQVRNLFNLKLEYFFRDQLVIGLNNGFDGTKIAIAEYPRWNGNRVDLSICSKKGSVFELESMIEMKYQFSGDFNSFKKYDSIFKKELLPKIKTVDKAPTFFILIVADWCEVLSQRALLENQFNPPVNSFNQYQSSESQKKKHGHWFKNVQEMFNIPEVESIQNGKITTSANHHVDFHYFIVKLK